MKIEKIAHDWCRVRKGDEIFEISLPDSQVFPEDHRMEIEKIKALSLEEFLGIYGDELNEIQIK